MIGAFTLLVDSLYQLRNLEDQKTGGVHTSPPYKEGTA